jgi:hypothetical protein
MTGESTWEASLVQAGVQVARVECQAVTLRPPDTRCASILRTQPTHDANVYCRRQDPRSSATRPSARAHPRRLLKSGRRGSLRRAPLSRPSHLGFGSPSCPHRQSRTCWAGSRFRPCRDTCAAQLPPVRAVPDEQCLDNRPHNRDGRCAARLSLRWSNDRRDRVHVLGCLFETLSPS